MLRALLEGQSSAEQIAQLAKGTLRKKLEQLAWALEGKLEEHHRFLLGTQLERIEQVEATVTKIDERIQEKLEPYREKHQRLMQIPGVDQMGAAVIIAELGVDMSVFPSPQHAADLGAQYLDRTAAGMIKRNLVKPLERLGYHVTLTAAEAPVA